MLYIFDMGGVILHGVFELETILKEQGCPLELFDLYKDDLMESYSAGQICEDEYWERFNSRYGTRVASPRWGQTFNPESDPLMVDFIRSLKKDHRVVCGTNTFDAHWRICEKRKDIDVFDKVYASHLMGVAKPSPEFWKIIMESEGYKPEDTVFIDDFEQNVEAAGQLGISSLLYKDINSLRSDLSLCLSSR